MYYFEDENLDLFLLGDYMQTQATWGPNYTDDYYVVSRIVFIFTIFFKLIFIGTRKNSKTRMACEEMA
jgi:hypothetical protein